MRKTYPHRYLAAAATAATFALPLSHCASAAVITLNTVGSATISDPTWGVGSNPTPVDAMVYGTEGKETLAGVTFAAYSGGTPGANIYVQYDASGSYITAAQVATSASGTAASAGIVAIAQSVGYNSSGNHGNENVITTFSNLTPGAVYEVDTLISISPRSLQIYYNDPNYSVVASGGTHIGSTPSDSLTTQGASTAANPNYVYDIQDNVTATGSGTITEYVYDNNSAGAAAAGENGVALFLVSAPEPSAVALIALAAAGGLTRRRRRQPEQNLTPSVPSGG